MLDSERSIENKVKVTLNSFRNFVYVCNYVNLKSFAWKRDSPISSELQMSKVQPRSFKKAVIEFYKLHPNRKH